MKQILLSFFLTFLMTTAFAQSRDNCLGCEVSEFTQLAFDQSAGAQISVYPNPATDFIMLKNASGVAEIRVFNLIGRQVRNFNDIAKGNRYPVADLPNGMYLVQMINPQGDVMTTHRMNKR